MFQTQSAQRRSTKFVKKWSVRSALQFKNRNVVLFTNNNFLNCIIFKVCEMIPRDDCVNIEMCPDTFEKECKTVPETKCIQVPMEVCETVTKTVQVLYVLAFYEIYPLSLVIINNCFKIIMKVPQTKEVCGTIAPRTTTTTRRTTTRRTTTTTIRTTTKKPRGQQKKKARPAPKKSYLPPPPRK